jgi:hypothetical protein
MEGRCQRCYKKNKIIINIHYFQIVIQQFNLMQKFEIGLLNVKRCKTILFSHPNV